MCVKRVRVLFAHARCLRSLAVIFAVEVPGCGGTQVVFDVYYRDPPTNAPHERCLPRPCPKAFADGGKLGPRRETTPGLGGLIEHDKNFEAGLHAI